MRFFLENLKPVRNAEGGGSGGGEGEAPAIEQQQPNEAVSGYRPEGLSDDLFGKDDKETIDKLHQSLKTHAERESQNAAPEHPDAYREFKLDEAPEALRPHLQALAKDPLFEAVAKVAHDEKLSTGTLQKLTTSLYTQASEMGLLDHVIDVEKERAALLPEAAKNQPKTEQDRQIEARLQANEDWVKLQIQHGLPEAVANHGLLMLMDTAAGNQLIEFFRSKMTGGDRDTPLAGDGSARNGQSQRDQLRERLAAPEMQAGHPKFDLSAYNNLMEDYRKVIGD